MSKIVGLKKKSLFLGQRLNNLLEKINIKKYAQNGCYAFLLFNHINLRTRTETVKGCIDGRLVG